jgi:hypothetical protein
MSSRGFLTCAYTGLFRPRNNLMSDSHFVGGQYVLMSWSEIALGVIANHGHKRFRRVRPKALTGAPADSNVASPVQNRLRHHA